MANPVRQEEADEAEQTQRILLRAKEWRSGLPSILKAARLNPMVRSNLAAIHEQTLDIELKIRAHIESLRACAAAQEREADVQERAAQQNLESAKILKSILDAIDHEAIK